MTKVNERGGRSTDIRKKAEEALKGKTTDLKKLSSGDFKRLVHELEVHQIELEMQNEELRRAQKELEEARNGYSDLYDFAPIGYLTFDKNGLILQVNLTGAKKLGIERGNLIKKPFSLYIAPDHKDAFYYHLRQVFNTETRTTCELRLMDKKGLQFDSLLESMPVRDSDGNLLCRTAMSDITERKRAEELIHQFTEELEQRVRERTGQLEKEIAMHNKSEAALAESEEKYRTLYDSSSDAIMLLDEKGFFDCNAATLQIFGFSNKEDFTNVDSSQVSPPYQPDGVDSLTAMNNKIAEAFRKGTNYFEWVHRKKNGEDFFADVLLTAFNFNGKQVLQATVRDITGRKRAEQELRAARDEAEHANMAKTNFLHTMSHELRTPLNAILGFSAILKEKTEGELNDKQEIFINNIITAGNSLHNIIGQILDVVKMYEGTLELRIENIPVPETLDEIIGIIKEKALKKNIVIEKNLDPELEYIEADKQKFRQVFINLLENAVKFSKDEGGTVSINAKKEGDLARFSVSDRGIGIKEADIEKLFGKFTQLDSGTSRKYGGTGIGLAITKQFVELHGGKIYGESKYGIGSTFTFMIPLVAKKMDGK